MAGAISMPVAARAAVEQVRGLMEGTTYTILGLTAFILLLVGFTVSAVLMYRSSQVSEWIAILVGVGSIVAMAGGPTEIHQLTASGFVRLGVGAMAAGLSNCGREPRLRSLSLTAYDVLGDIPDELGSVRSRDRHRLRRSFLGGIHHRWTAWRSGCRRVLRGQQTPAPHPGVPVWAVDGLPHLVARFGT